MFDKLLEKNKIIENAIKKSRDGLNQESLMAIIRAVQTCICEKSHVLVPISNPEAENGENYMLRTTYNQEHKLYAVAFTNAAETESGGETSTLLYEISTILNIVLATEGLHGLVFNPWGEAFYMPKSVIQLALEASPDSEEDYVRDNALLDMAIHLAVERHAGQVRKGTHQPYILHPLQTMNILSGMKADTTLLTAGVLYNILNKTDTTRDEIVTSFGTDIAALISSRDEDKNQNFHVQRTAQLAEIKKASLRYKMLVMAEHVSVLTDLFLDNEAIGPDLWEHYTYPKEKLSWYYSKLQDVLIELKDYPETEAVYWQMVNLYKALFVTYYFDRENGIIYQQSTHYETYILKKGNPEWQLYNLNAPDDLAQISQYDAEKIEDAWKLLSLK